MTSILRNVAKTMKLKTKSNTVSQDYKTQNKTLILCTKGKTKKLNVKTMTRAGFTYVS